MPNVLVFFEHLTDTLSKPQRELLTQAARLGTVHIVSSASADTTASTLEGIDAASVRTPAEELVAPDAALVDLLAAAVSSTQASVILSSPTADATDVMARAAVRADGGLITQAVGITEDLSVMKSVLAGSYTTTAAPREGHPLLVTMKPNAVPAEPAPGTLPEPEVVLVDAVAPSPSVLDRAAIEAGGRPGLAEAATVVAGGRGLNGDFTPVEDLADLLGAAVGASRAAADAGWVDHSAQVGQTGATVSPQLYVSLGISGAVQQRAGMQTSQTIVAINRDEDAPVFDIADFAVVGDLFEIVPQVIEKIRHHQSS